MQLKPLQTLFPEVDVKETDEVIRWVFPNATYYCTDGESTVVFTRTNQVSDDWCYISGNVKYRAEYTEDYETLKRKYSERKNSSEQLSLF